MAGSAQELRSGPLPRSRIVESRFAELWHWQGTIGRKNYAIAGIAALAAKYFLDKSVASIFFHRVWYPWSYWSPMGPQARVNALQADQRLFASVLLLLAIPFVWLGVTLTVQRLRDAGQPVWLVVLFFVPVVNLLLFALLCVMGTKPREELEQAAPWPETHRLDGWIPRSKTGAGFAAIGISVILGLLLTVMGTEWLKNYGWGLFVALPFCLGLFAVMVYSYHEPRSLGSCLAVSLVPIALVGIVMLVVALEGLICILMAAPVAIVLAVLGGSLGYAIQSGYWHSKGAPAMLSVVLLFTPAFLSVEHFVRPQPDTFEVKTAMEVNAPPERVWNEVIAFAEIPPPKEMVFRAGIAYPIRAEILGHGAGAERHCEFSTGAFVEPIEVWDEPHLLRFSVKANPPPLTEWTPYAQIDPPHLHGFFVSHQGQFLLSALPGGGTRLEGTTWYQHTMWPEAYWHLWSDYIIRQIHLRVLEHIRAEAESTRR
jgi:uncharacterized membrane protein YhaH (DUF805 family)